MKRHRISLLLTRAITVLAVTGLLPGLTRPVTAREKTYVIEGHIHYSSPGTVYVYLVDEEMFRTPLAGIQTLVLPVRAGETRRQSLTFRFDHVAPGIYGIRCFQDANHNGKLDRGLFGPSEPWGMSWKGDKPSKWPRFSHIAFEVKDDLQLKPIELE